jgi:hypothetical protein
MRSAPLASLCKSPRTAAERCQIDGATGSSGTCAAVFSLLQSAKSAGTATALQARAGARSSPGLFEARARLE